jgi:hypothetical protein
MKHLSIVIGAGAVILVLGTTAMAQVPRRPEGPPVLQPGQPAPNAQPAPGAAPPAASGTPASPVTPRQIPGGAEAPVPTPQPPPAAATSPPQPPPAAAAPPATANVEPPPQPIPRRLPGEATTEAAPIPETSARTRTGRPLRQTGGPPADYMGNRFNRREFAPMPYGGMPMTPSSALANPPYPWRGYPPQ